MQSNTKVFFCETPSNPTLELVDIAAISALAKTIGARVVVDNVFATPFGHRPIELGADVVAYSATKHIDGQGRCLGGVVLGSQKFVLDELLPFIRNTGPSMSPFNAWVLLKGLGNTCRCASKNMSPMPPNLPMLSLACKKSAA